MPTALKRAKKSAPSALYKRGLATRRAVLGREYVDRSIKNINDFTAPLQQYLTEFAWGSIWNRPGLTRKERSMINLAMLTALGRAEEVALHVRGALNNGLTLVQIRETLLHTLAYCGAPAALDSFRIASKVLAEEGALPAPGTPKPRRRKVARKR